MKTARFAAAVCAAALAALSTPAIADRDHDGPVPRNATFTTQAITPLAIEGLTADEDGNLYTTGRDLVSDVCPVWKFTGSTQTTVGFIPNPATRAATRRASHLTRMATCTSPTAAPRRRCGSSRRTPLRLPSRSLSPRACRERTGSRSTATAISGPGRHHRPGPGLEDPEPPAEHASRRSAVASKRSASSRWRTPPVSDGRTERCSREIQRRIHNRSWRTALPSRPAATSTSPIRPAAPSGKSSSIAGASSRAAPAATPPSPPTPFAWTTSSSRTRTSRAPTASRSTAKATSGTPPTSATPS